MGNHVCHFEGWFFLWSTIVDAPVTGLMRRDEFDAHMREEHGRAYMAERHPHRIRQALERGTSSLMNPSLDDLLRSNRAGPNETKLTIDEVKKMLLAERYE